MGIGIGIGIYIYIYVCLYVYVCMFTSRAEHAERQRGPHREGSPRTTWA